MFVLEIQSFPYDCLYLLKHVFFPSPASFRLRFFRQVNEVRTTYFNLCGTRLTRPSTSLTIAASLTLSEPPYATAASCYNIAVKLVALSGVCCQTVIFKIGSIALHPIDLINLIN